VAILRVVAGLHNRTAVDDGIISNVASYKTVSGILNM
jgi:hypothetical protein